MLRSGVEAWIALVITTASRLYLLVLLSLVTVALLPAVAGWQGSVVQSGSMEPLISPGDVVLSAIPPVGQPLPDGAVVAFRSSADAEPSGEARTRLHRVIGTNDDGTFITAGDANSEADSTPLERVQVIGLARLLVPHVGLPALWLEHGDWWTLLVWGSVTAAALVAATRRHTEVPSATEEHSFGVATSERRASFVAPGRRAVLVAGGMSLAGLGMLRADPVSAGFTASSGSVGSTWTVEVPPPLVIGRMSGYTLFAATSVVHQGFLGLGSDIGGSIGTSPGTVVSGISALTVDGEIDRNTAGARNARADARALHTAVLARAPTYALTSSTGNTLRPGVHSVSGGLLVNGTLVLDGGGDPGSVFVFQAADIEIGGRGIIRLINGASALRVFWASTASIVLNGGSTSQGTFICVGDAVMNRNASLQGRLVSLDGSISIIGVTTVLPR